MIVEDHTQALITYLREEYDEQEQALEQEARREAQAIIEAQLKRARAEAQRRHQRGLEATKRRLAAASAAASYAAKQEQERLREDYLKKGLGLIEEELKGMDKRTRGRMLRRMRDELKNALREAGQEEEDFTIEEDEKDVAIKAYNEKMSFEDSLRQRLEERSASIKHELLKRL